MHPVFLGTLITILTILAFSVGGPVLALLSLVVGWYVSLQHYRYADSIIQEMYRVQDRGVTYAQWGDYPAAIEDFNFVLSKSPKILSKFPLTNETFFNRGTAYYCLGNFPKALEDYAQNLLLQPDSTDAYINRGGVYAAQGNHSSAIKDYERASQLNPDIPVLHYNWGNSHRELNDSEQAIHHYNHAIHLDPQYIDAYFSRGYVHGQLEDYDRAIEDYSNYILFNVADREEIYIPIARASNAEALVNRGAAYFYNGNYSQAIEDCTQAIQLDPKNPQTFCSRGFLYFYLGENQMALNDFVKVVKLDPSAGGYYNKAIAEGLLDMRQEAIASLDRAIGLDENLASAYYLRGNIRYSTGDRQDAMADFHRAIAIEKHHPDTADDEHAFYARGLARYYMGDVAGAVADLQQAAKICQRLLYFTFHQEIMQTLADIQSSTL